MTRDGGHGIPQRLGFDVWVVTIGRYHFGPFTNENAVAFADEHGGETWPLWACHELDGMSGKPALDLALAEVGRGN